MIAWETFRVRYVKNNSLQTLMLEEVQFKEIFGSIGVNANFNSPYFNKAKVCSALFGFLYGFTGVP